MAETFNNYLTHRKYDSNNNTAPIIPLAGETINYTNNDQHSFGERPANTTLEVHSIYVTLSDIISFPADVSTLDSLSVLFDVYIVKSIGNNVYKGINLAKAIKLVPNSSFYIEKTVTLLPNDGINIYVYSTSSTQQQIQYVNNRWIDTVCSTVEITPDS